MIGGVWLEIMAGGGEAGVGVGRERNSLIYQTLKYIYIYTSILCSICYSDNESVMASLWLFCIHINYRTVCWCGVTVNVMLLMRWTAL